MTTETEPLRPAPSKVAHLTTAERRARGKAARTDVPRSSHAGFEPLPDRRDPIEILQAQAATRVPDLVPVRYGRMVANPFAFYRGAAAIMAADLATTPNSGLRTQLCGDAHLLNFGMYFSADRRLVFDINDFDETLPGPWEWDVKRLAASIAVAGRANSFSTKDRAKAILRTALSYRNSMVQFAGMRNLEVWYARIDIDSLFTEVSQHLDQRRTRALRSVRDKAVGRDNLQAFGKLTEMVDGEPRFVSMPPLVVPISELAPQIDPNVSADAIFEAVRGIMRSYRSSLSDDHRRLVEQFRFVDLARKVVGVGSVGTRAWVALLLGRDVNDPLIIQVKQAQESVLEPYAGRSRYNSAGRRVVAGQRLMQASSDIFLGWHRGLMYDGVQRDFYFRQLKDGKGSFDPTTFQPEGLALYGQVCAWTLARAHARSGDAIAISAYLGRGDIFDRAILDFAEAYADQNERDHAALVDAVKSGRIEAIEGI